LHILRIIFRRRRSMRRRITWERCLLNWAGRVKNSSRLTICRGLASDGISGSDGKVITGRWDGKYSEGVVGSCMVLTPQHMLLRTEEKHEIFQSGLLVPQPRFEPHTSRIHARSINLELTSSVKRPGGPCLTQVVSYRLPTAAARVRAQFQVTWDLWWTKWHWGRFSSSTSVSPSNSHSTDCSTFIIIYHPGLVQYTNKWRTYQVDSASPRPKKQKKVRN
jgi:hypothetical protein